MGDAPASAPRSGENAVDWRQLRALLVAWVKLDIRASRGATGRTRVPPFVIALITSSVMGLLLAIGLRPQGDAFVYSLFTISAAMFMTALAVIMEYVTIVAHPDDHQILAHRPVSSRTYFWGKLGNLLCYVTPIALALTLPAAVFDSALLEPGARFGVVHVIVGLVACLGTSAAIVLLFSLGRPAFPVDTHVHRVTKRLGLIGPRVSREKAHVELEALVVPDDYYAFHLNLIRHGRQVCSSRKPGCEECLLSDLCDYARTEALKASDTEALKD